MGWKGRGRGGGSGGLTFVYIYDRSQPVFISVRGDAVHRLASGGG